MAVLVLRLPLPAPSHPQHNLHTSQLPLTRSQFLKQSPSTSPIPITPTHRQSSPTSSRPHRHASPHHRGNRKARAHPLAAQCTSTTSHQAPRPSHWPSNSCALAVLANASITRLSIQPPFLHSSQPGARFNVTCIAPVDESCKEPRVLIVKRGGWRPTWGTALAAPIVGLVVVVQLRVITGAWSRAVVDRWCVTWARVAG
ncbi:hypothetical protein CC80DRAFT_496703, partial [Byssothecium circinans]